MADLKINVNDSVKTKDGVPADLDLENKKESVKIIKKIIRKKYTPPVELDGIKRGEPYGMIKHRKDKLNKLLK